MVTSECHLHSDSTEILGDMFFKRLAVADILFTKKVVTKGEKGERKRGIKDGGEREES